MSTKFEAAARALAERWHDRDLSRSHGLSGCVLIGVDGYLPAARDTTRLVLEAIREPDEAMVKAMHESDFASFSQEENGGCDSLEPEKAWQAGVDVLLAEARGGK